MILKGGPFDGHVLDDTYGARIIAPMIPPTVMELHRYLRSWNPIDTFVCHGSIESAVSGGSVVAQVVYGHDGCYVETIFPPVDRCVVEGCSQHADLPTS